MSNYDADRPLPKRINKKVIGLIKNKLGGNIMIEFVALRPKTYSYLTDNHTIHKKAKTKKCVIRWTLKFNNYKYCLFKNKIILKSRQRVKSEAHNVCTEQIKRLH